MNIQKINELLEAQSRAAKKNQVHLPTPPAVPEPSEPKSTPQKKPVVPDISQSQLIANLLQKDTDYGLIQGCRKPSLFKSGAEKLAAYYHLRSEVTVLHRTKDLANHFIAYEIKVTLYNPEGAIVAEGLGAANTKERKFARSDFYASINTVIKMARKRAFVDAVLTGTAVSGVFTQDIEDIASSSGEMNQVG